MNIDDIYLAAVNGEKDRLISLLEANEVDINEAIDCGVNNGTHTKVPLLYSILSTMYQQNQSFNYEIIDILISYDMNIDAFVLLSNDAFTRQIPILCYAIRDWKSLELVTFFMQRGANPNIRQYEHYSDGHNESYPLAYFAIVFWDDYRMLEVILGYGANPNDTSIVYNQEHAALQSMPLLFHALITCESMEKCIALFRFSADINVETVVSIGPIPKISFKRYVATTYRRMLSTLETAYNQGRKYPLKAVTVSRESFVKKPRELRLDNVEENEGNRDKAHYYINNDGLMELRALAIELIDYDKKVYNDYQKALRDSQIQPKNLSDKKFVNTAKEYIESVHNFRSLKIKQMNVIDEKHTGGKQPRWWNTFNYLNHPFEKTLDIMLWIPFERIVEGPDGLRLTASCTSTGSITAKQVDLLIKSEEVSPVYMADTSSDEEYSMAEICLWGMQDATEIRTGVKDTFTQEEVESAMRRRSEGIDDLERFLNTLSNKGNFTDEELLMFGDMKHNDYLNSKFNRDYNLFSYENKLRNSKTAYTEITNQSLYYQQYIPIGFMVLDKNGDAVAVLVYNTPMKREIYTTDNSNNIVDVQQKDSYYSVESARLGVIRNLELFPIEPPDVLAPKPDYLTEMEWDEFIYNNVLVFSNKILPARIQEKHASKGAEKRNVIHSQMFF